MNSQTPGTPNLSGRGATSREFFAVIFRRKWLILGLFFVTTATVVTIALTTPVVYQSSGRVLLQRGERQSALSAGRQIFSDWEQDLGSEMEVARSYPVLHRAREILKESARRGGPVVKLDAGSVDAEVMGKSNVLGLGYKSRDREVAQQVCDALITAYVDYRRDKMTPERPEAFFDRELSDVEHQIEVLLERRRRFSYESGMTNAEDESRSLTTQNQLLEQRRDDAASDLAEAQATVDAMRQLRENPDIDLPTISFGGAYTNEQALVSLKQKIVEQQTKIAQLSERFRDGAAEVENAKATLVTLQGLLRKEVDARVTMSQTKIEILKSKIAVYDRDIAAVQKRIEAVPVGYKTLGELDADIRSLRDRQRELQYAHTQTRITANTSQDVSVVLLSPAGVAMPLNQLDVVRLGLAPAFSLVVGIAIAFFVDGLDLTVRTANQAEEYLELPVLASLTERRRRRG